VKQLGHALIGAVLFLPLLAIGAAALLRDLWRMRRVRWTR
jgi:hypothetical protein